MRPSPAILLLLVATGCDDRIDDRLVFDNPKDPLRSGADDDGDGVNNGDDQCPLMGGPEVPDTGVCAAVKLECPADKATDIEGYQATETLCDDLDNDCDGETDEAAGCQGGGGDGGGGGGGGGDGGGEGEGEGEGEPPACDLCGRCEFDGAAPLGASCGRGGDCRPAPLNPDAFRECLDAQCEAGFCVDETFCSRTCEDDGDCQDGVDGPVGAEFVCVRARPDAERGQCRPGSNARCESDGQCDEVGEVCVVDVDHLTRRLFSTCQTRVKCALSTGQACTDGPAVMEKDHCQARQCFSGRCTAPCEGDDDCQAPYDRCLPDAYPVSHLSSDTRAMCVGDPCDAHDGCPGGVCEPLAANTGDDETPTILGHCAHARQEEGYVADREPCGTAAEDGDAVFCDAALCGALNLLEGQSCLPLCGDTADCLEGERCDSIPLCVHRGEDGECIWADAMVCTPGVGSMGECGHTSDCPEGEACRAVIAAVSPPGPGPERLEISSVCHEPRGRAGSFQPCEGNGDCSSGVCVGTGGDSAHCFPLCGGSDDCEDNEWCVLLHFSQDGTLPVSVCSAHQSSGVSCAPDVHSCSETDGSQDGEFCIAQAIASTGAVEYHCIALGPGRDPGAECEADHECESLHCWPGKDGAPGHCDRGCANDGSCPDGFECLWSQLADGAGPWNPATARRCRKVEECGPCTAGGGCGDGFTCSYEDDARGGRRAVCLRDCESNADCAGSDIDGPVCTVIRDAEGNQLQDKVCAPDTIQECGWPAPAEE